MAAATFVRFEEKFKLITLKRNFHLNTTLYNLIGRKVEYREQRACEDLIDTVVKQVKETHLTTSVESCCISLGPNNVNIHQLKAVAQALYQEWGIEIQQVDVMPPRKIVVTCHCDHPFLNPPKPYENKSRKTSTLTDCTLIYNGQQFPAHRTVLSAKSPQFEALFTNGCKESAPNAVIEVKLERLEAQNFGTFLHYLYMGELNLQNASITLIDNLANLSSYYHLPHLEQLCFEHLCKNINISNCEDFLALARHYKHEELESALFEHLRQEITLDNIESFILLARDKKIESLESWCLSEMASRLLASSDKPEAIQTEVLRRHFALATKYQAVPLFNACVARAQEAYVHLDLENRIKRLALACEYSSELNWLPTEAVQSMLQLKNELAENISDMISRLRSIDAAYWTSMQAYLEVAATHNLSKITQTCDSKLSSGARLVFHNLSVREKLLGLADQFNLTGVKETCAKLQATLRTGKQN